MQENAFSADMIFIDPPFKERDSPSVITYLCERLAEKEYINGKYLQEVLKREVIHPTGLPTLPYGSAVPHANPIGVKKTGIALAILRDPISFYAMDNPKNKIDVRLVFLMTFMDGNQVAMLRWISNVISNQSIVKTIAESETSDQAYNAIEAFLNLKHKGA